MLPHPYTVESMIAEHRKDLLREAEQDRLARLAVPRRTAAPSRLAPRARVAEALRRLADRVEPAAALPCEQQGSLV